MATPVKTAVKQTRPTPQRTPQRMTMRDKMKKVAEGGGGYVCMFVIEAGYKIFVKGLSNDDSFFPFDPGDEEARAEALENARGQLDLSGNPTDAKGRALRPQKSVQLTIYRDHVYNREVGWQGDRQFVYPTWSDSYTQVLEPSIDKQVEQDLIPDYGVDLYGRISFAKDPSGRQRENDKGEMVDELVPFIAEIYASEEEARTHAQDVNGAELTPVADGFTSSLDLYRANDAQYQKLIALAKTAIKGKVGPKRDDALIAFARENLVEDEELARAHVAELRELVK